MRHIISFIKFYIGSSIHVALAICCLMGVTSFEFEIEVSTPLLGMLFFGSITGYNFIKYATIKKINYSDINLSFRKIEIFYLVSFVAFLFFVFQLPLKLLLVLSVFAILTFFYAIPFLSFKRLRAVVGLKIIVVSVVWAGVTLLIPLVNDSYPISSTVWISFVQRIIFVFVLTLPFEIRDLKNDALFLGTVPQKVGVQNTKKIGLLSVSIILVLEYLKFYSNITYSLSLLMCCIVMLIFLFKTNENQTPCYTAFWVESIPVFWFIGLYVISVI